MRLPRRWPGGHSRGSGLRPRGPGRALTPTPRGVLDPAGGREEALTPSRAGFLRPERDREGALAALNPPRWASQLYAAMSGGGLWSTQTEPPTAPTDLPSGWEAYFSEEYGRYYFHHGESGATQWVLQRPRPRACWLGHVSRRCYARRRRFLFPHHVPPEGARATTQRRHGLAGAQPSSHDACLADPCAVPRARVPGAPSLCTHTRCVAFRSTTRRCSSPRAYARNAPATASRASTSSRPPSRGARCRRTARAGARLTAEGDRLLPSADSHANPFHTHTSAGERLTRARARSPACAAQRASKVTSVADVSL